MADVPRRRIAPVSPTYFGYRIRRNNIHRLIWSLLEGPQAGKISRGRPRTEWMTNITERTGMRYEYLVKLAQDRITTANLLKEDEDDDDIHLYKSYAQTGMWINSRNNILLIHTSKQSKIEFNMQHDIVRLSKGIAINIHTLNVSFTLDRI